MKKLSISFIILLLLVKSLQANPVWQGDSLEQEAKWFRSVPFRVLLAPTVLATTSLLLFDPAGGDHTLIKPVQGFETTADDYLQFAPMAIVYGLDLAGVKAKNDVLNQSLMLLKAEAIMALFIYPMKAWIDVPRPDGSGNTSFPSGHTAQAFVSATFMHKEFGHLNPWVSISAYAMATTTGVLRILQNEHRLTDVLMGAGIGILATNIAYATHRYKWGRKPKGRKGYSLVPTYNKGSLGVYFSMRL